MSDPDPAVADALRWLRYSTEDLDVARVLLASSPLVPRHVCWLAQQSAEKALKAALVLEGVAFPFTHDLDALCNRFPDLAGWYNSLRSRGAYQVGGGGPVPGRLA